MIMVILFNDHTGEGQVLCTVVSFDIHDIRKGVVY